MAAGSSSSSSSSTLKYFYFRNQFCTVCLTGGGGGIQGGGFHCFASSINGTITLISAVGPNNVCSYGISISPATNSRVSSVSSPLAEPCLCFLGSGCEGLCYLRETGGEDPS